ncbi:N-acetylmuramoyl-L-alanine amidase-like domain-containing protein [Luteolibacter sp. AS25]|uniref:N-acetylmuramoyl-L-alanine amidase-like domain-containing protein n=1 Tax=Luteolibacter sp. AS25 TaxID=3135776 RepID=UPI00398BB53D
MNSRTLLLFLPVLTLFSCAGPNIEAISMNGSTKLKVLSPGRQAPVPPLAKPRLPLNTVFKGEAKFFAIMAKAERENWRILPIGERTVRVARELLGAPYTSYSLEVDDHIESPVANLIGMDCWTFYENSLAISRLIAYKPGPYKPEDLLQMIEIERYRDGVCTGNYLSRMHHLEEVFHDNQRRGYAANLSSRIPGAERLSREIKEMTVQWKSYRYLKNNPSLIEPMGRIEAQVSKLPVYHIPKNKARTAENYLANGDICAITSTWKGGYTSHVGLIVRIKGRAYFAHATSDRDKGRMTIIDRPITDYLNGSSKHAGIIICRPFDIPRSPLWQKNVAGR